MNFFYRFREIFSTFRSNKRFEIRMKNTRVSKKNSKTWYRYYVARSMAANSIARWGKIVFACIAFCLVCGSAFLINSLGKYIASSLGTGEHLQHVQTIILTIGGALIGAAAIVSSIVLFAMQVNIERAPQGMFRILSKDLKLIFLFALSFFVAVTISLMSIFVDWQTIGLTSWIVFWGVIFNMVLFLASYERAILLVNPTYQIDILLIKVAAGLQAVSISADRIAPMLIGSEDSNTETSESLQSKYDLGRLKFFSWNLNWAKDAEIGIKFAMSYAKRFSEHGEYDVVELALGAIVRINHEYLKAKGNTFVASSPFIEMPLTTDRVINHTLEELRRLGSSAIIHRDEQLLVHVIDTYGSLTKVYSTIEYGDRRLV